MRYRQFVNAIKRAIYDCYRLFLPNSIFLFGIITRNGVGYSHYNWGDDLNIWMIEEISDLKILVVNRSRIFPLFAKRVHSCIGSILGVCYGRELTVWGSGFISENERMHEIPKKIYSVRGPLTRHKLLEQGIDCPATYGDPALLVSKYYHPNVTKKYKYGIIPHFVDEANPVIQAVSKREDILIISMANYGHWHDIPDAVCSCEMILSSSLHGLIVSDSYGIPNAWARFSNNIKGGDFKYFDYFQSVGRNVLHPVIINDLDNLLSALNNTQLYGNAICIDFDAIYDACPFKSHLKHYSEF